MNMLSRSETEVHPQERTTKMSSAMLKGKPLFTGEFIAFSDFDRVALRSLIRRIQKPFKRMLEVGSWLGNGSTKTFIEELSGGRGVLYCVDTWKGNSNVTRHQAIVSEYDVFATFLWNVSVAKGENTVKPLLMSSKDAAEVMADDSFDLIFIDGDHSYTATKMDIEMWSPKIRKGGILCGHDCEIRPEVMGREYLWQHRLDDTVRGNARLPTVHPGPILAVDEAFSGSAYLWAEEPIRLDNNYWGYSTIWDVIVT